MTVYRSAPLTLPNLMHILGCGEEFDGCTSADGIVAVLFGERIVLKGNKADWLHALEDLKARISLTEV